MKWHQKRRLDLVRERGVCMDDLDRLAEVMIRRQRQINAQLERKP